jgi:hypothetical protein
VTVTCHAQANLASKMAKIFLSLTPRSSRHLHPSSRVRRHHQVVIVIHEWKLRTFSSMPLLQTVLYWRTTNLSCKSVSLTCFWKATSTSPSLCTQSGVGYCHSHEMPPSPPRPRSIYILSDNSKFILDADRRQRKGLTAEAACGSTHATQRQKSDKTDIGRCRSFVSDIFYRLDSSNAVVVS